MYQELNDEFGGQRLGSEPLFSSISLIDTHSGEEKPPLHSASKLASYLWPLGQVAGDSDGLMSQREQRLGELHL